MSEPASRDRLFPCLLDRLMKDEPDAEGPAYISYGEYRRNVVRDLGFLLNTPRDLEELKDVGAEVRKSVLNFGMADIAGRTAAGVGEAVGDYIRQAILDYEPRIVPETVTVTEVEAGEGGLLAFEIRGHLWAQPVPRELYVKTEIDLETGQCEIRG